MIYKKKKKSKKHNYLPRLFKHLDCLQFVRITTVKHNKLKLHFGE